MGCRGGSTRLADEWRLANRTESDVFTGIVEATVKVLGVRDEAGSRKLTLERIGDDLKPGQSVAVNGVCLTVADLTTGKGASMSFDLVAETLKLTNLGRLVAGDGVHVERSLAANGRLDGHFVLGHIDGMVSLVSQVEDDNGVRLILKAAKELAKYLIPKGSVAIDGVSLTIASIKGETFEVALIPTTMRLTMLTNQPEDWMFNLETDVLSKTVVSWLERRGK
jgi:riboflavin synthase